MGSKTLDHPLIEPAGLATTQWEAYQNRGNDCSAHECFNALLDFMERNNLKELNTSTHIIIVPGYEFKVINGMITNFHQPHSTLLLLIAAFLGDEWKRIYDHALKNDYRFLSYGDSNLYLK